MTNDSNIWPKVITVDKNIIKILSESTYENFPNALKELITNSYDASATEVKLEIDLESETIRLEDNGKGMDSSDYEFYLRIAGKHRKVQDFSETTRKKVGQFGVGFLSVFPFFKDYSIQSKKRGMNDELYAHIPCQQYFDNQDRLVHINDIKINGGTRKGDFNKSASYTRITLTGFTQITREFFFPKKEIKTGRYSIKNPNYYGGIDRLNWVLSEDLPIEYEDDYFNELFKASFDELPFKVYSNGEYLKRKVYAKDNILETHTSQFSEIGNIKFQYFISTDKEPIHPNEGRFLKMRNLNVGVGSRENFIGKEIQGGYPRLQQLTGEIHIMDGMNELIKVSREGFNYSADYEEMKSFFARRLIHHSAKLQEEDNRRKASSPKKIRSVKDIAPVETKNRQTGIFDSNAKKTDDKPIKNENTHHEVSAGSKTIIYEKPVQAFEEDPINILEIEDRRFIVKSDKWNFETNDTPACKIEDESTLIINSRYPLFQGVKHTDVFIKLHVFLLLNRQRGRYDEATYKEMAREVLDVYSEYWKEK